MPKNKPFWKIQNITNNATEKKAQLLLYGEIVSADYWWLDNSVSPDSLIRQLENLNDVTELEVRINSTGGDVFAASAIYNLLKDFNAHVTVYIDGLAASAATLIAMAGDVIKMPVNSLFMIHNPSTYAGGEAGDLTKAAELLQKVKDVIIATYMKKSHLSESEISTLMDETTWMSAHEAKDYGFIDEIAGDVIEEEPFFENNGSVLVLNSVKHDLKSFKNAQQKICASLKQPNLQVKTIKNISQGGNKKMSPEEIKNQYPESYKAIQDAAIDGERSRIKAIEDIATPGMENIIDEAKFESGVTAEQVAMNILKAQKETQAKRLSNVKDDASKISDITPSNITNASKEDYEELLNKVVTNLGGAK
ncbi:MAG TPA: head maturation protease, ClpP-related [Rummeliibacillus sp.]|nr:head maturation protease, ClpP-related [Rummeliibacillus sp.]